MSFFSTNIPVPVVASTTSITLAATTNGTATRVQAGGKLYTLTSTLTMNSATTGLGGLDTGALAASTTYYLYFCASSVGLFGLVASTALPATGPSGFSGRYTTIGQFTTNASTQIVASAFSNAINGQPITYYDIGAANFISSGGVTLGGYTDAGAWTLGASGGSQTHIANGLLSVGTAAATRVRFAVSGSTSYMDVFGTDTSTNGDLSLRSYRSDSSNTVQIASCSNAGAWTLGASSTSTKHTIQTSAADEYICYFENATATTPYGVRVRFSGAAPNDATRSFFIGDDTGTTRVILRSNGGIANYQANDANLSDERTKTDIKPAKSYLDVICAIPVVTFKYKDQTHDDDNLGVIAQQVEAVAPEFIDQDGWGTNAEDGSPLKSVYNTDLMFAVMKAVQELKAENDLLKARLAALEV